MDFESLILMNQAQIMNVMRAIVSSMQTLSPENRDQINGLLQNHIDITVKAVKENIKEND